jgi:hypothetical protein
MRDRILKQVLFSNVSFNDLKETGGKTRDCSGLLTKQTIYPH